MVMEIETNKVYLAQTHTARNIAKPVQFEVKNANFTIKGSLTETLTESEMTSAETLSGDSFETLNYLPRYVCFVGTADKINIIGYDLTFVGDLI